MSGTRSSARTSAACLVVVVALAALSATSCTSTWRLSESPALNPPEPPRLSAFQAVAAATIALPQGRLDAVVYLSRTPAGAVRAHLTTDSGLTIADVEADGATDRVHAQSEFARLPGLLPAILRDMRRIFGSRSVWAAAGGRAARDVLGDPIGRRALRLSDGSWVVVGPSAAATDGAGLRVTLLDPSLRPEASIEFEDPGPEDIPRSICLRDLDDGHALTLDVQELLAVERGDSP